MIHIFIVNPEAGKERFNEELREELSTILDIEYYVFNTRGPGSEMEIVRSAIEMFDEDQLRIYCCGGSGTVRNVMQGMTEVELEKIELAFYPCGLTNSFLLSFPNIDFSDLGKLIRGKAHKIDYIKTNHGVALNDVSVGIFSDILERAAEYRHFGFMAKSIPYYSAFVRTMLWLKTYTFNVSIDDYENQYKVAEIFFGNGGYASGRLRKDKRPDVRDGKFGYRIVRYKWKPVMARMAFAMENEDCDKFARYIPGGYCETARLRLANGKSFNAVFDGELVEKIDVLELSMKNRKLKFVFPEGVDMDE